MNTVVFDKGDGAATINLNGGTGTLQLASDIAASDVILQADNAGNLTVALRDEPTDFVTIKNDLSLHSGNTSSAISSIQFLSGGGIDLTGASGPTSTWIGTASDATLTASNYGSNLFDFREGLAGSDLINGFNPSRDAVQFSATQVSSFTALQADASSAPGGTLISLGQNNSLLLQGVTPSQLQSSAFRFV